MLPKKTAGSTNCCFLYWFLECFRMTILTTACPSTIERISNEAIMEEALELNTSAGFLYFIAKRASCYQHYTETPLEQSLVWKPKGY